MAEKEKAKREQPVGLTYERSDVVILTSDNGTADTTSILSVMRLDVP